MKNVLWLFAVVLLIGGTPLVRAAEKPPAVVELFEDDTDLLIPQMTNDGGGDAGAITREAKDRFTGSCSFRVTPMQRFASRVKGWSYPITEKPAPGEYRYLRFAWKKVGGQGIMVQFNDQQMSWGHRYKAGVCVHEWQPIKSVAEKAPADWEVVTVDLWKDWGNFTLMGMALTPQDGDAGLYDHFYLGRTVEDLDKVTDALRGKARFKDTLAAKRLDELWADLKSGDPSRYVPAQAELAAAPKDSVPFVAKMLSPREMKPADQKVAKWLAELDDDRFAVRENATEQLTKVRDEALDALKAALASTDSAESRMRLLAILGEDKGDVPQAVLHARRAVGVLERAGTPEARKALEELTKGDTEPAVRNAAAGALARWKKRDGAKP